MVRCSNAAAILVLSVLLCTTLHPIQALDTSEEVALREILQHHPDLYSVPAWETFSSGIHYGSSWNDSISTICQNDGYNFFGVYCRGGHVVGLRVTRSWGISIDGTFPASSGLVYLSNITSTAPSTGKLLKVLCTSLPLQHIDTPLLNLTDFNNPNAILSLSITLFTNDTLPPMPNLRYLKLAAYQDLGPLDLAPLCASPLQELLFNNENLTSFIELVNCLPNLERVEFGSIVTKPLPQYDAIYSPTLKHFSFKSYGLSSNILLNCSALEELIVICANMTFEVSAPNLKIFRITGWNLPSSFTSFHNLVDFYWSTSAPSPRLIPSMAFAPNLRSFDLGISIFANMNLSDILASLPQNISSVKLESIELLHPGPVTLPSTWTSLVSLWLSFSSLGITNDTYFSHLHSLEELHIADGALSMEQLLSFPNLRKLTYWSNLDARRTIEFPPNFFAGMKNLTEVRVSNLAGTVPWYGLENLEVLDLQGVFTSWPSIQGTASHLRILRLDSPYLNMIPTDTTFRAANVDNLQVLFVYASTLTTTPFFWNDSPNIETVYFSIPRNLGALPRMIDAPRLQWLTLIGSYCGLLPDFRVPTHIKALSFQDNVLQGPIPQSWEDNLSIIDHLSLRSNRLNGTIPPHLFDHHASFRWTIDLGSNDFTGPTWNMSTGAPRDLRIDFTGLDICLQDPDTRYGLPASCSINSVPKCPSRCPAFWDFCYGIGGSSCTEQAFTPRAPPLCPVPNITCPLPQPGAGFECNHGTWIFLGDSIEETISLPPSAGPIIIFGNLSTNGTITFSGTGTSIEVQGCVLETPTQIVVELPAGATPDSTTLLTQRGKNCSTDLSQIPIVLVTSDEDCKKRSVSTNPTPTTLTAVFNLDDRCQKASSSKTKWIILGSSLGGVFVLLTLILSILHVKSPCFRTLLRTCSLKKALVSK